VVIVERVAGAKGGSIVVDTLRRIEIRAC